MPKTMLMSDLDILLDLNSVNQIANVIQQTRRNKSIQKKRWENQ